MAGEGEGETGRHERGRMRSRRLAILGLALTLVGLVLAIGFWPVTSVSGAELAASRSGNTYQGYSTGSRITIRERILDISYQSLGDITNLELDDGDAGVATVIVVRGDATTVVKPGDVIYTSAVLQTIPLFGTCCSYWEVATPQDLHPSWPVDAIFYGIMATGVALLALAALRKPVRPPEG